MERRHIRVLILIVVYFGRRNREALIHPACSGIRVHELLLYWHLQVRRVDENKLHRLPIVNYALTHTAITNGIPMLLISLHTYNAGMEELAAYVQGL